MKKKSCKKKILAAIILVCITGILVLSGFSIADDICYLDKIEGFDGKTVTPTVDFIQPWLTYDWEQSDWERHFDVLSEAGYDTLIWQYSRYGAVGATSVYYPTTALSEIYDGEIYQDKTYMLGRMFDAADAKGFKIFLGLSVEDSWWSWKQYAEPDYLDALADIEVTMIGELNALYGGHQSFYGWYFSYEMLSNIHGYEVGWAAMMNKIIAKLNSLDDGRPLLFSPFIHKFLRGTSTDTYKMWKNFFSLTQFRQGDIFCPQDSIGKINRGKVNAEDLAMTYRYVKACKKACDTCPELDFWVNCELFATPSDFNETDLFTADIERIKDQYAVASRFADCLVTFSYSHYFAPTGNADYEQIHKEYCDYVKNIGG